MNLSDFQNEVKAWNQYNFPNKNDYIPLLGAVEEIGELAHAYIKADQKIRGTIEEYLAAEKDAIGDAIIYLTDFCWRRGYSLEEVLEQVWSEVKKRDWVKYPINGLTA